MGTLVGVIAEDLREGEQFPRDAAAAYLLNIYATPGTLTLESQLCGYRAISKG
jgi:hypothetical protein